MEGGLFFVRPRNINQWGEEGLHTGEGLDKGVNWLWQGMAAAKPWFQGGKMINSWMSLWLFVLIIPLLNYCKLTTMQIRTKRPEQDTPISPLFWQMVYSSIQLVQTGAMYCCWLAAAVHFDADLLNRGIYHLSRWGGYKCCGGYNT